MCKSRIDAHHKMFLNLTTVHFPLPSEIRMKIFSIAFDEELKKKGDYGLELLMHWMFHVWGFGLRVPKRSKLKFDMLHEVEVLMSSRFE
jgi:hypothetical protein